MNWFRPRCKFTDAKEGYCTRCGSELLPFPSAGVGRFFILRGSSAEVVAVR